MPRFFSYQWPHCFKFEKPHAAGAVYAPSAMKKVPVIDDAFFGAIHRQRLGLADEAAIAAWVARQGIDLVEFEKMYWSFSVGLQTRRADEQSRKIRLPIP